MLHTWIREYPAEQDYKPIFIGGRWDTQRFNNYLPGIRPQPSIVYFGWFTGNCNLPCSSPVRSLQLGTVIPSGSFLTFTFPTYLHWLRIQDITRLAAWIKESKPNDRTIMKKVEWAKSGRTRIIDGGLNTVVIVSGSAKRYLTLKATARAVQNERPLIPFVQQCVGIC